MKSGERNKTQALPTKTMGRPLLIGDEQVQEYVQFLQQSESTLLFV